MQRFLICTKKSKRGVILAVFLIILWLKKYDPPLMKEVSKTDVLQRRSKRSQNRITYRTKRVEYEACINWYHVSCGNRNTPDSEYPT